MRVWQIEGAGLENLKLGERPAPTPGHGQVRIRVTAASLNYRDLMIANGSYRIGAEYPLVPLSDGAGVVDAIGEGVTKLKVGDRVTSSFFYGFIDGAQTAERNATALGGGLVDGMLAEQVVLPENGVLRTPEHLSDLEAATLPCAALTAWHSLYEGVDPLRPGQVVLLEGTGGVSIFGLQLARIGGARVIITSSSDEKLERARALGAHETINYKANPDWEKRVRELTNNGGVDHVIEVGGKDTMGKALSSLRYGGQMHLVGGVSGFATELPLGPMAAVSARVRRIYVGSIAMFEAMNRALSLHQTKPVIDKVYPFQDAKTALEHMQGAGHFGKICIQVAA